MRIFRRLALVAAACTTALVTAFGVGTPASAVTGLTITPGGNFTATASPWTSGDPSTGTQITCQSLVLSGVFVSGPVTPGAPVGQFNSGVAITCTGPLGITFTITLQNLPWSINVTSFDSGTGTVTGTVSGIEFHVSGAGCTFDVRGATATSGGTVTFTYRNSTHTLTLLPGPTDLHFYNPSGACSGLVNSGDAAQFSGDFGVQPPQTFS